jgi:hypothetical protein
MRTNVINPRTGQFVKSSRKLRPRVKARAYRAVKVTRRKVRNLGKKKH